MKPYTVGRRYRANQPGHIFDGRTGTLEFLCGNTGYLMVGLVIRPIALPGLTDHNVLQGIRPDLMRQGDSIRAFESDVDEVLGSLVELEKLA